MIEIFKTNVEDGETAGNLIDLLLQSFPGNKINFDLHDCDKILRIEGLNYTATDIMTLVKENGYYCELITS